MNTNIVTQGLAKVVGPSEMRRNTFTLASATLAAVLVVSGSAWGQTAVPRTDMGYPGDPYAADSRDPFDTTYPHEYPHPQATLSNGGLAGAVIAPLAAVAAAAPLITGRSVATGRMGSMCSTPAKTCELYHTSFVGGSCSCRVAGGRALGSVTP